MAVNQSRSMSVNIQTIGRLIRQLISRLLRAARMCQCFLGRKGQSLGHLVFVYRLLCEGILNLCDFYTNLLFNAVVNKFV